MNGGVTCSWLPREKHVCNECIWRKGKCTIGRASMTQWAPCRMGSACKKVHVVLQLMIKEEPKVAATGEVMVTEEAEAAGEPAAEAVVDEDVMMQDAPEVAPLAEVGLSADATRMSPMDAIKALLGVWSDDTIHGYLQPSLAEITWQNLQETRKLHKSSDHREKLKQMIIRWLDTLVGQGHVWNAASVWGKGKQKAEESASDSEEQLV